MILLICVVALYSRNMAAMMFAFCTASHCIITPGLDGWLYYLSAGATDVAIIGILATINKVSATTRGLILVSIMSLISNLYGQVMWFLYYYPDSYNYSFTCLYALSVAIIIRGDNAGDINLFDVFSPVSKGHFVHRILPKEAGS